MCFFDYSRGAFRVVEKACAPYRLFRAMCAVVAVLFAVRIYACLWLVGFLMRSYNIRIVYCPLMSAYVRVLTFSLDILTIGVLWNREVDIHVIVNFCRKVKFLRKRQSTKAGTRTNEQTNKRTIRDFEVWRKI